MGLTPERKQRIIDALNGALLNDEEMKEGLEAFRKGINGKGHPWKAYPDPFFGGEGAAQLWDLPELGVEGEYEEGEEVQEKGDSI